MDEQEAGVDFGMMTQRLGDPQRLRAVAAAMQAAPGSLQFLAEELGVLTDMLGVPAGLVTLVDEDRQVFLAHRGLPAEWAARGESPLSHSLCQYVVVDDASYHVSDLSAVPSLSANRAGELGVAAYLGVPLRGVDRQPVGAVCAIDAEPRTWTDHDQSRLEALAEMIRVALLRSVASSLHELDLRERAAVTAHDLRSPFSVVSGAAQSLARLSGDADTATELVEVVQRAQRRFDATVSNLLDEPVGGGMAAPSHAAVDVAEIVEEIAAAIGTASARSIAVRLPAEPCVAAVGGIVLARILQNLCENSIRHGGDEIRISVDVVGDQVSVVVEDDGPGLPEELHFDTRSTDVRRSPARGRGLGIVVDLATQHGGHVRTADRRPRGTAITVTLPRGAR